VKSAINEKADDPELFKSLIQKPSVAWPTITLLVAAYVIFGVSTFAFFKGALPLGWAMLINSIASYMAFPVAHDATHSAVCANRRVNDWVGRISMILLEPGPFFQVFRFIHMKHHRFTNHSEKDPDVYCGTGPAWLLPFKWLTLDYIYFKIYLLFFIPTRIAKYLIIIAFDFLPHYPHESYAKDEPFRCTSNRVGMEWLLTPIFIYQNYHLVHHLYPAVPFYRNIKIWNSRKNYHESQNPAITDTFSLSPR